MKNKRWQNVAYGLAFIIPVVGAYLANRLIAQYRNRALGTRPEVTHIRVPLTSLIGLNAETVEVQKKPEVIVLPSAVDMKPIQDDLTPKVESPQDHFIGSMERGKFHRLECRFALNIKPDNSILFASKDIALAQGYIPCGTCKP